MRTKSRYGESNVFISTHSQWAKESEWDSLAALYGFSPLFLEQNTCKKLLKLTGLLNTQTLDIYTVFK